MFVSSGIFFSRWIKIFTQAFSAIDQSIYNLINFPLSLSPSLFKPPFIIVVLFFTPRFPTTKKSSFCFGHLKPKIINACDDSGSGML
jgi:hypothetical protein